MAGQEIYGLSGLGFTIGWTLWVVLVFGIFQWLHISIGSLVDWVIGGASFWWLIVIVTLPWNIHFRAKAVLSDAAISLERGIKVADSTKIYAAKVAQRSLWIALGLHLISAIALYLLSATGVSGIGYVASIAALLLTGLRPTVSAYRYLVQRLQNMGQELKYPREDIMKLKGDIDVLTQEYEQLAGQLNPKDANSWLGRQQRTLQQLQEDVAKLSTAQEHLKAANDQAHDRISQETRSAIAQLNADSQFLDQVREIIRFFKAA